MTMKLFTAEWCHPCQAVKMKLATYDHAVEIIDVDKSPELARAAGVRSVPALYFGDGSVLVGAVPIMKEIEKVYGKGESVE